MKIVVSWVGQFATLSPHCHNLKRIISILKQSVTPIHILAPTICPTLYIFAGQYLKRWVWARLTPILPRILTVWAPTHFPSHLKTHSGEKSNKLTKHRRCISRVLLQVKHVWSQNICWQFDGHFLRTIFYPQTNQAWVTGPEVQRTKSSWSKCCQLGFRARWVLINLNGYIHSNEDISYNMIWGMALVRFLRTWWEENLLSVDGADKVVDF